MLPLNLLTALAIVFGALAAAILLMAVPQLRRSRSGAFYGTRRDARARAKRRLSTALLLTALAAGLFALRYLWPELTVDAAVTRVAAVLQLSAPTPTPTPLPTPEPTQTPTRAPTRTPAATATRWVVTAIPERTASLNALPTLTLTPAPTASATPVLTGTATPAAPAAVTVTVVNTATVAAVSTVAAVATNTVTPTRASFAAITPTPNTGTQRLTLRAIGTGVDASGNPAGGDTRFPARTRAIFVFFEYNNVPPSATVKHTWFYNGASAYFRQDVLNRNGVGMASVAWTPEGGFEPGLYEVRVLLGNVPQFVANFEIR